MKHSPEKGQLVLINLIGNPIISDKLTSNTHIVLAENNK